MTKKFMVIAVAVAGYMAVAHSALAHPIAPIVRVAPTHTLSPLDYRYLRLYHEVADRNGSRAPGRNIVRQGLPDGRQPSSAHVARSIRTFERWLHPPAVAPAPVLTSPVAPNGAPASAGTSYSGGMPACTWQPESGGSYTARNPSGAGGKYQIMPSTWKANGGVEENAADAPPAEQEAVARRVMETQGPGAWVNC